MAGAGDTAVNIAKDLASWNLHSRMGDIDKKGEYRPNQGGFNDLKNETGNGSRE